MNALDELFNKHDVHEIDPTRLEQGCEAVCTCGAACVSFTAHIEEVKQHRKHWDEAVRKHGHPLEHMIRAGWTPPA